MAGIPFSIITMRRDTIETAMRGLLTLRMIDMDCAISVDWREEFERNPDKWENVGRSVIVEACTHKTQDKNETNMRYSGWCEECGFYEDSAEPMMNYAYPIESVVCPPDDAKVREVVEKTNLTVMYNTEADGYFLVLTGGGMNLSQDIALAYNIIQTWLPTSFLSDVSSQYGLSVSGKDFDRIKKVIIDQAKLEISRLEETIKKWKESKPKK